MNGIAARVEYRIRWRRLRGVILEAGGSNKEASHLQSMNKYPLLFHVRDNNPSSPTRWGKICRRWLEQRSRCVEESAEVSQKKTLAEERFGAGKGQARLGLTLAVLRIAFRWANLSAGNRLGHVATVQWLHADSNDDEAIFKR